MTHDHHDLTRARGPRPRPVARPAAASSSGSASWADAGCSASSAASARGRLVGCGDDDQARPTPRRPRRPPASAGPGRPPGGGGAAGRRVRRLRRSTVADGEIPEETAGPYPGDGSNGVNVLSESGIVRSDLTSSFGSRVRRRRGRPGDGQAQGLRPQRRPTSPRSPARRSTCGTATATGSYSMYSEDVADENYLRGVQEAAADGTRAVHHDLPGLLRRPLAAHALRGLRVARRRHERTRTSCAPPSSRIPEDVCEQVYGVAEGYEPSVANLAGVSLDTDGCSATATRCSSRP